MTVGVAVAAPGAGAPGHRGGRLGAAAGGVRVVVVGGSDGGAGGESQRVVPRPGRRGPTSGVRVRLPPRRARSDRRDRRRPVRVRAVRQRQHDATAAGAADSRGADVRRSVEQRAVAGAGGHARSRTPRHHRSRHAHLDRGPDDGDDRGDDPRLHDHRHRDPRPLRDQRRRSSPDRRGLGPLRLRDQGQSHRRDQRDLARHRGDHRTRPAERPARRSTSATRRSRRRAPIRSTRSAPCCNPDARAACDAGTVSGHAVGGCPPLSRERELLGSRTLPALLRRGPRASKSEPGPRRRWPSPAPRSVSTAARWDASILLGPRGYDGGAIDLLQWHEPTPIGAPPASVVETGFQRLGLRVPDLDDDARPGPRARRVGAQRAVRSLTRNRGRDPARRGRTIPTAPRSS